MSKLNFILASTNAHKAQELQDLFKDGPITVAAASEKIEVDETGDTFQENAFLKAKTYFDKFGVPTIADDSGLVVESMPEILGVKSARFAPELPDYKDKNQKLLEIMQGKEVDQRRAYFVCYLCCYLNPKEVFFFEGRVHGYIGEEAAGEGGFGYDPVFYPDGQNGLSLAQLHEWKMKNSHRAKACREAASFFQGQISLPN